MREVSTRFARMIRPATRADLAAMARIHAGAGTPGLLTDLGVPFLRDVYYRGLETGANDWGGNTVLTVHALLDALAVKDERDLLGDPHTPAPCPPTTPRPGPGEAMTTPTSSPSREPRPPIGVLLPAGNTAVRAELPRACPSGEDRPQWQRTGV